MPNISLERDMCKMFVSLQRTEPTKCSNNRVSLIYTIYWAEYSEIVQYSANAAHQCIAKTGTSFELIEQVLVVNL